MKKVAVVYWSGTGNTEMMANAIVEGVKASGNEVELFTPEAFQGSMVEQYDVILFGCPAMGAEELEDAEFAPMFEDCKNHLENKSILLFGSYGWGDGEWMREWEEACKEVGAQLLGDSIICENAPDDEALEQCRKIGEIL